MNRVRIRTLGGDIITRKASISETLHKSYATTMGRVYISISRDVDGVIYGLGRDRSVEMYTSGDGPMMTKDEMLDQVRACPSFSSPDDVCIWCEDGTGYTGHELCDMAGVAMEVAE